MRGAPRRACAVLLVLALVSASSQAQVREIGQERQPAEGHVDVACEAGKGWEDMTRSIVRIYARGKKCTGVLLNNTAEDGTPYVLTARHCGELHNAVFTFNYKLEDCGGEMPELEHRVSGAKVLVWDDQLDFQLVRLYAMPKPEFHVLYAGWDHSGELTKGATTLHHPAGSVMKISHEENKPKKDSTFWRINRWEVGLTEKGSSGAPLFDSKKRVIGQLSGADESEKNPGGDLFGRLEKEWLALQPFLDPLGLGKPTLDALDPTKTPLAFDLVEVSPNPVPFGRGTVEVRGMAFSAQATLSIDGTEVPRERVELLSNSRFEVELPEGLATGEHRLAVLCFETGEVKEIEFELQPPPPPEEG